MEYLGDGRTYEMGGLLAAGATILQSQFLHQKDLAKAKERHEKEISLAKEHHIKALTESKRSYLLELLYDLEQHFQQLNADLIASSNESERDMFDQRNQNFQTIILASSVMFTGLSTAIVDGILPEHSTAFVVVAFALTSALSFFFLFICVVICIELVIRASNFMYRRARKHADNLRDAIKSTKKLMDDLNSYGDSGKDSGREHTRRTIITMLPNELNAEWASHEPKIQRFLSNREALNDRVAVVSHDASNKSFADFWRESCRYWERIAIISFYLGTLGLLLCIMVFLWATFVDRYHNLIAATCAVVLIGSALVLGSIAIVVMRCKRIAAHTADRRPSIGLGGHGTGYQGMGLGLGLGGGLGGGGGVPVFPTQMLRRATNHSNSDASLNTMV